MPAPLAPLARNPQLVDRRQGRSLLDLLDRVVEACDDPFSTLYEARP